MAYNQLEYRPNVKRTEQVHGLIAPGHCWHFDAWLYGADHSPLILLRVETRAGGRDLLTAHWYYCDTNASEGARLRYCNAPFPEGWEPITMQDRGYVSRFEELNALHHRYVLPMAARVPAGFRSRSVALHYVRAPSLEPFSDDALNLSQF